MVDERAVYHCIIFLIPMHVRSVRVSLSTFSLIQGSRTLIVYYATHRLFLLVIYSFMSFRVDYVPSRSKSVRVR